MGNIGIMKIDVVGWQCVRSFGEGIGLSNYGEPFYVYILLNTKIHVYIKGGIKFIGLILRGDMAHQTDSKLQGTYIPKRYLNPLGTICFSFFFVFLSDVGAAFDCWIFNKYCY